MFDESIVLSDFSLTKHRSVIQRALFCNFTFSGEGSTLKERILGGKRDELAKMKALGPPKGDGI